MCVFFFKDSIVEKIRTIAQKVYGADDIELSPEAQAKIDYYNQQVRRLYIATEHKKCTSFWYLSFLNNKGYINIFNLFNIQYLLF